MAEDGWPGQGDMTAEQLGKISGRQTSFPFSNWLMSGGHGVGRKARKERGSGEIQSINGCKKDLKRKSQDIADVSLANG